MITQRATVYPAGVLLSAPYDPIATPALVAELKRLVPMRQRRYNPETREWFVSSAYQAQALGIFYECFPDAETVLAAGAPPPPPPTPPLAEDHHFATLHLRPTAPREVVDAVYRVLAKHLHPDMLPAPQRDQAHRQMVSINIAYEALRAHLPDERTR